MQLKMTEDDSANVTPVTAGHEVPADWPLSPSQETSTPCPSSSLAEEIRRTQQVATGITHDT